MRDCIRFIGLDDSKDAIEVAVAAAGERGEVRHYGVIPNTPEALRKLVRRLGRPRSLDFVYEAGPNGYGIHRELQALGAGCVAVAPSRTPRRAGERIKWFQDPFRMPEGERDRPAARRRDDAMLDASGRSGNDAPGRSQPAEARKGF
jgi:hypothetical protein